MRGYEVVTVIVHKQQAQARGRNLGQLPQLRASECPVWTRAANDPSVFTITEKAPTHTRAFHI